MHDPVLESHHLVCEKPQTRRGIERRLALLLSATELFLEKGYDAVSLDDIVNHAGGSKTSIYKYFGNKDGLFTAICDYRREMFFKDICIAFQPELLGWGRNTLTRKLKELGMDSADDDDEDEHKATLSEA